MQDELNIILNILRDQRTVLTTMLSLLDGVLGNEPSNSTVETVVAVFKQKYPAVEQNILDFERMEERADRIYTAVEP